MRRCAPVIAIAVILLFVQSAFAAGGYVASKNSEVYHLVSCGYVGTISERNKIYFDTWEEAEASGRRGCSRCHPHGTTSSGTSSGTSTETDKGTYSSGYSDGKRIGYQNGYSDGESAGYESGVAKGKEQGYKAGVDDAKKEAQADHTRLVNENWDKSKEIRQQQGEIESLSRQRWWISGAAVIVCYFCTRAYSKKERADEVENLHASVQMLYAKVTLEQKERQESEKRMAKEIYGLINENQRLLRLLEGKK